MANLQFLIQSWASTGGSATLTRPTAKGGGGQHGLWLVVTVPRMQQEPQTTVELIATLVFRSPTVLDSPFLVRTLSI